ncbi:transcription-repair coupling factor [Gloeocapsa sp. PCC 73106]|uniref:transcription-repair coupling factor n=1 Tax=Gloeocapsa sp. PCC 73106 TaxID=102232 RepID=UPI0002ACC819|nr:transcription-repair coupling factor [Gloeocapsa sp. PCC 73106]ELR99789.1 transcription-repair coupling factor Mfd [Gloeocapsa sp. PCC 73106]
MAFSSIIRTLQRSPLSNELVLKLQQQSELALNGVPRLAKGLIASSLAQKEKMNLLVVCATLEEAGRWTSQLEAMDWDTVHFYPTSEASPYDPFDPESEMIWGQLQVLADLAQAKESRAIVATERALQRHLPPLANLQEYFISLQAGTNWSSQAIETKLVKLGLERVALVENEGQWSRRGDILDIFPVSAELPVRLEWFGDQLEQIREFDPSTQRSLDKIEQLLLTPTSFSPVIASALSEAQQESLFTPEEKEGLARGEYPEGMRRYLGLAFSQSASLIDYLPTNTLMVLDEMEQLTAHSDRALTQWEEQWQQAENLGKIHTYLTEIIPLIPLNKLYLRELSNETTPGINLSSRPIPTSPHQFAKIAEILRGKREIYSNIRLNQYSNWLISAQPLRSVSLLQEHDCPAAFVANPRDYPAIDKVINQSIPVALKYAGMAELEGFILPSFRIAVITDREFFGQHNLATPTYIRKRRRALSKQVDINKLTPGDYVVHKTHGIGKFTQLESLATREYLVIQYADGLLRVPADSLDVLSRYRQIGKNPPELHRMSSKAWENTKNKVRKTVKKLAVDLLKLYALRTQATGYAYPQDQPWQSELEDSFPYQVTPDQLKAIQDVKRDLESDRPMDRLICGDVGFGKTEVAIRAIFKVVAGSNKQVAFLAPTTILTQQHYHTLKERFAPYPINIGLLNRFRTALERKEILERLATGEIDVVVGTQQLLSNGIKFRNLGLLVIDEEQRFGVNQKEKIKEIKTQLDVLTLSATPIPRTLYMSISGVREMSLITTPPPSRRPIKTHLSPYNLEVVRNAIRNELDRGGQIFYVVPRVEGIEEVAAGIRTMVPGVRIAIAHGQMVEAELESTMLGFNNGDADILLCTTIIESGLDIPRVNTIVVEDAHRFGLSQLYQLRGRVGRSGVQAHAWLLYPQTKLTEAARQRLRALQEFTQLGSGYQLAMRDLEIRGVGNLLGAEQSGQMAAIGFDLYVEMLQEAIKEIQGQEIPQVEETQIDLAFTAFIPTDYIPDLEQKMEAYRSLATANSSAELTQIALGWNDRYGPLPPPVQQLLQVLELKQLGKSLGFARIKTEAKQNVVLETPMEEPAWKLLADNLPQHIKSRFIYTNKKVVIRGLAILKPQQQLETLIEWFHKLKNSEQ